MSGRYLDLEPRLTPQERALARAAYYALYLQRTTDLAPDEIAEFVAEQYPSARTVVETWKMRPRAERAS